MVNAGVLAQNALLLEIAPEPTVDEAAGETTEVLDVPTAGLREQVRRAVGQAWVEELGLEYPLGASVFEEAVEASRDCGRRLRVFGDVPESALPPAAAGERWTVEPVKGLTSWVLTRPPRARWQFAAKRTIDLAVALPLLILLLPLLVVLAVAVALTSSGGPFYRWRVLGENGRAFTGYKLRTMYQDADARKAELIAHNEMIGPVFKMAEDPRVTPLGRFLRKYSLDELPQLWSVVAGDMSLVGPRPVFPHEYRDFELAQMRKLTVKPGMTCLWQARGRHRINDLEEWVRLDLDYIDSWSLRLDLQIVWETFRAVAGGTGV